MWPTAAYRRRYVAVLERYRNASDHFGHRVLHLHSGIHLDEVKAAVLVEEFESAGAAIADLDTGVDAGLGNLVRAGPQGYLALGPLPAPSGAGAASEQSRSPR